MVDDICGSSLGIASGYASWRPSQLQSPSSMFQALHIGDAAMRSKATSARPAACSVAGPYSPLGSFEQPLPLTPEHSKER